MLTLHARPLSGQDFVVCETAEVPIWGDWDVKMTIDDGLVSRNSNAEITLTEGYFFLIIQAQLCLNQFKIFFVENFFIFVCSRINIFSQHFCISRQKTILVKIFSIF